LRLILAAGDDALGEIGICEAVCQLEGGLEALGEALGNVRLYRDAVYHHLDVVLVFLVERGGFLDGVELPIDADAGEAGALPFRQLLAILTLAAAHDWGEQIEACSFRQGEHAVHHLADGLRADRQAGGGGIGDADARPEQAHVIVDLSDGGDRGARVAARGLLLDADGGREAVDMLDIRLLHHLKELARVSREALHIAALALRVDRVEREARLAGARKAGDDDQCITRQIHVDALEVVLARAAHGNMGETHIRRSISVLSGNPASTKGLGRR
jgi:hypothetical protein